MKFSLSSIIAITTAGTALAFVSPNSRISSTTLTTVTDAYDGYLRRTECLPSSRKSSVIEMAANGEEDGTTSEYDLLGRPARPGRPLKVAIAGGGVGGLTTALCMLKKGFDVTVYEKTAAFARFGGPIQFASNALSVIKEIDEGLFERVMDKFTFTGTADSMTRV